MMNYLSLEKDCKKSCIAWFKLAEVVMRGEKERVLTMYRLLIHSLSNEPLKIQLEAEILQLFGDSNALVCFVNAAQLYSKNNELAQAIFLYKRIVSLAPEMGEYKAALNALEDQLKDNTHYFMSNSSFSSRHTQY